MNGWHSTKWVGGRGDLRRRLFMRAYSAVYNLLWDNSLADLIADALVPAIGERKTVLDIGAGTGVIAQRLIDRGYQVSATEPEPRMRQRFNERLPAVRCEKLAIDELLEDLEWVQIADCLLAVNVVHMTHDPVASVDHLRRIGRRSTLIVVTPDPDVGILRTLEAMRSCGVGVANLLRFVAIHLLLAPLTLVTSSGISRRPIAIESPQSWTLAGILNFHVWPAI